MEPDSVVCGLTPQQHREDGVYSTGDNVSTDGFVQIACRAAHVDDLAPEAHALSRTVDRRKNAFSRSLLISVFGQRSLQMTREEAGDVHFDDPAD